jgi:hypothetical protein
MVIAIVVATRATVGVAVFSPTTSAKSGMATRASPNPKEERTKVDIKNMIKTIIIVSCDPIKYPLELFFE